jgi:transposase
VRHTRMLLRALGVERAVVEDVKWELRARGGQALVVRVRPLKKDSGRCPHCGRGCPRFDRGAGTRRWRAPSVGLTVAYVEAEVPRVRCNDHGVVVQRVPWARHNAGFTTAFEDQTAWLAARTDKTTLSELLGVAWRTVGAILERVAETMRRVRDPLAGVTRIGIDEVSYRKGHRYLTIVVDHDSGRLLWASPGHDEATLRQFFDLLGSERSAQIQLVSADAAAWIRAVVHERCPNATQCLDPFHVVQWATRAVDEVRRGVWNELRRSGEKERAAALKGSRWALWKNPEDLTPSQRSTLSVIERDNRKLFRAYLMKESLRAVFHAADVETAKVRLELWLAWAARCRIAPFVKLARSVRRHRRAIENVLEHGLSNARIEAAATKLRLLTRLAFGFHSHEPLIALAMLKLGGLCPPLPRST